MEQNNKGDFYPKHQINIDPNILLWQKVYSETKTVKVVKEVIISLINGYIIKFSTCF